jgi:hypothetical protein
MVYRPRSAAQRHTSYPPTGVFYPAEILSSSSQLWEPTQSTPPLLLATTPPGPNWIKIPQRNYNHGKRQWNFERSEPVSFSVNGRLGVNMGDALRKAFAGLDGRDDPVLQNAAGAISCRFLVGLL